tara:strand:- start:31 stop:231 length:201 start_codon:yes stop_codon:yes gene_type:complete
VETSLLKMIGLDLQEVTSLKQKIISAEKFSFTKDEVDLIYKLAGFDLLSVSEMKALILLFTEKLNA